MSYLTEVLADAPRHYWRCADPGGRFLFDIGSSRQVLPITSSNFNLPYLGPVSNGGSFFTSDNGGAQVLPGIAETVPQTVEAWVWVVVEAGHRGYLVNVGDTAGNQLAAIEIESGGQPRLFGPAGGALSPTPITYQRWHHIVGVSTVGSTTLYVDGVSVAVGGGGTATVTAALQLGGNPNTGGQWPIACLSECAVYRSALSAARVAAHFAAADQVGQSPVYAANGSFSLSTGAGGFDTTDLALILQSVRKTF